jgi:hypothetical protein
MNATHKLTRQGMKPVLAEIIFASPNFYVFLIDGVERTLPAVDGKVRGFTVTKLS